MSSQEEQAKEYINNFIRKKNIECPQLDGLFCCPNCYQWIVFEKGCIKCMKCSFFYKIHELKGAVKRDFDSERSKKAFEEYTNNFDNWFIPFNKRICQDKNEEEMKRKNKGIKAGEFIYGVASLLFGFPTMEGVLANEILSQTSGSLHFVLFIFFALIFFLGIFALIDFIFRLFGTTLIDKLNKLIRY